MGYSIDSRMKARIAVNALEMAVAHRGRPTGVIVHSDRGSQFRSRRFLKALKRHGLTGSMGRVGACGDCEHRDCATTRGLTLAYDRPGGCPRVDVSAPGGGVHQAAGRVGSDLIGA